MLIVTPLSRLNAKMAQTPSDSVTASSADATDTTAAEKATTTTTAAAG